ncbi:Coenzyme Q-binding protein coq10, mitochondrial [Lachnellula cervina]|uniref:Coenzyme Q-binding protein coq10, mitochondrial n=1 Tax=Lachnellula cervina TaxID=1316786 RepID=A0A7D8UU83_9HELO|nr:Coenzyme Q-binding protein coq10, mitochondrial [Lachnellula cervina]
MSKVLRSLRPQPILHSLRQPTASRSFITLPGTEAQTLTATRILPYNSKSLYTLIADIDSYSSFLPYCLSSRVTKWSAPDKDGKRWPSEADLKIGWGGYEETFTSRLFCVPGSIVEALGGEAVTSLPRADLEHHKETLDSPAISNAIFQSINTQWRVKPFHYKPPTGRPQTDNTEEPARDRTEVHLILNFQFSNPLYAALSKAVAPKVAGIMIEAFEVRARKLLDVPGATLQRDKDGVTNAEKQFGA